MKRLKKVMAMMFAVLMSVAVMSEPVSAQGFKQETLDGVIYIYWEGYVEDIGDNGQYMPVAVSSSGTGFFTGEKDKDPQYIVTNYHVVQNYMECESVLKKYGLDNLLEHDVKQTFPLYVYYDQDVHEEAYVVDYDEDKDLAILRLDKPTSRRKGLPLRKSFDNLVGESVWAVGYPAIADRVAASVTKRGKEDATVTVGSINRVYTETGTGVKTFQTDAKVRSGNSGGPLVDENGAVLGVNTRVANSTLDPNLNYVVSVENLMPMLKKNDIPYHFSGGSGSFAGSVLFWVCIAVAVVVVAVVVILVVRGKKKSGKAKTPKQNSKKSGSGKPFVRSVSAQHKGMMVALSDTPLLIGRDASVCRIVFGDDTPGVSSKHCQIAYNSADGTFILTDVGSTYGTFLSNEQKLEPNVPCVLKAGDSFYLGEPANLIYVGLG